MPPPFSSSVEEGPAPSGRIKGAPSFQPVWISFFSAGITFLSESHQLPLGFPATFLLHWPIEALMVSPELAHSHKNPDQRVQSEEGLLSSSWASFSLVPTMPRTHFSQCLSPGTWLSQPSPPSGLGLWVGKHSSASGISPAGSSRKSELERESLTLGGCPVTKQDQSSGKLVPWSAGDTPLTSAHLDFGTWVSEGRK